MTIDHEQVAKSPDNFKQLLQEVEHLAGIGHWIVYPDTGKLIWSDEIYRIHGLEVGSEINIEEAINVYHPDDRSMVTEHVRRAIEEKENYDFELRLMRADGEIRYVHSTGRVRLKPNGDVESVFGILHDITEQKKHEEELNIAQESLEKRVKERTRELSKEAAERKEIEEELARIFELSPDMIGMGNLEGYFTKVNPSFEQLLGYKSEDFCKRQFLTYVHEEDLEDTAQALIDAATGKRPEPFTITNRYRCLDGTYKRIEWKVQARVQENIFYAVGRDITNTRIAEENIRKLSLALEQSPSIIFITNTKGIIEYVNPMFTKKCGYTSNEVIGKTPRILEADRTSTEYDELWQVIKQGYEWKGELVDRRKDGSTFRAYATVSPVKNENGDITHFVAMHEDITERNALEEQLRRTQKMEALGKLTGGVAHDYNNILSIIIGYGELLGEYFAENPKASRYIDEILLASNRGKDLTGKLLTFSRYKPSKTDFVDINAELRKQRHMLEKTLTARISLTLDLIDDAWLIKIDNGDLSDAVINMAINASHAIPNTGKLIITTRNMYLDRNMAIALDLEPGNYVTLSIEDTGTGMDSDTASRIFDPFFSTKGDKGTGLGLSQVYGFIQRSGGNIKLQSTLGQGTKFTLYFPGYKKANLPANEKPVSPTHKKGQETILVVDDEPALCSMTAELLSIQGYQVLTAENAEQALETLKTTHVDFLLSDIIMPNMNGYQLAAVVSKLYPDIIIQLASGYNDSVIHEHNDFMPGILQKPYTIDELLSRIRYLLDTKKKG